LAALACRAQFEPPAGYYATAQDLAGPALRAALHQIIAPHNVKSYDDARTILAVLDADAANSNKVVLMYSGQTVPAAWDAGVTWNREHLWPDSRGLAGSGPDYCDLFNLRPCNPNVNAARGNKWFDVSDRTDAHYVASAHVLAPLCSADGDSWQPRTNECGDIARALFYMDLRYDGVEPATVDLCLTNAVTAAHQMGILATLLAWHLQDPVDEAERRRNSLIYSCYQTNRNPFVDHPEYAVAVYGVPEPALLGVAGLTLLLARRHRH
jgi:endonuclease I